MSERLDERNRIKGRLKNLEEIKMNELLNEIQWRVIAQILVND